MNNGISKPERISAPQLFFIFLVSRAVVALTFYQSILKNGISPDTLISALIALAINLLLCIPPVLCCIKEKNPLDTKSGRIIYSLYFLFFAGVNISRFAFFASDKTSAGSFLLFIIIMAGASCYAAYLSIEAISRFSVICALLSIFILLLLIALNIKNFEFINFIPFFTGGKKTVLENSMVFSSNSIEPALLFALFKKTDKNQNKSLYLGIAASYIAILLMLGFCIGVLGSAAPLFTYPVYTLFQMTAAGSFSRLDILYTAFGFFALFAKCSVIIYVLSRCVKASDFKIGFPLIFVFTSIVSYLLYRLYFSNTLSRAGIFYFALSIVFNALIPIIRLVFRRKKGAKLN